jgi:hypothetical protein
MSEKMTIVRETGALSGPEEPFGTQGMTLHKFVKPDSWRGALTLDASGENLPQYGSAWVYSKEVVVSPTDRRVGATPLQITAGISERGYFLFPVSDDV